MEVSYALTVLGGCKVEKMSSVQRLFMQEEVDSSLAYDFSPLHLKAASGGAKMFQDADGNSVAAPLKGYIIDGVKARGYWPEKDGNKVPFCSSLGGVRGWVNENYTPEDLSNAALAREPHEALIDLEAGRPLQESYRCGSCPLSAFGSEYQSGLDTGGQACKLKTLLLFLPEGWHQPCLLWVPTMSVKLWSKYASGIKQRTGMEFFTVKTQIDIEKTENKRGNPFGLFRFSQIEAIEEDEIATAVLTLRRELRGYLTRRGIDIVDEEMADADVDGRAIDPDTGEILEN